MPFVVALAVAGTYQNTTGWGACFGTGESALVREQVSVDGESGQIRMRLTFTPARR